MLDLSALFLDGTFERNWALQIFSQLLISGGVGEVVDAAGGGTAPLGSGRKSAGPGTNILFKHLPDVQS